MTSAIAYPKRSQGRSVPAGQMAWRPQSQHRFGAAALLGGLLVVVSPVSALTTYWVSVVLGGVALTILFYQFLLRQARFSGLLIASLAFTFWMGLSVIWAPDRETAIAQFLIVIAYQTILCIFAVTRPIESTRKLVLGTVAIFTIVEIAAALVVLAIEGSLRIAGQDRWTGQISTRLSAEIVLIIPFLICAYRKGTITQYLVPVLLVICLLLAMLAESRSGLVMVPVSIIASLAVVSTRLFSRLLTVLYLMPLTLIAGFVALQSFNPDLVDSEVVQRLEATDPASYLSDRVASRRASQSVEDWGRKVMYATGIDLAKDTKLIGHGSNAIRTETGRRYRHTVQSHNIVLTVIAELGIIGCAFAAAYIFALFAAFRRTRGIRRLGNPEAIRFRNAIVLAVVLGLILAQYKTMQANPIFFMSIGALFSIAGVLPRELYQASAAAMNRVRRGVDNRIASATAVPQR